MSFTQDHTCGPLWECSTSVDGLVGVVRSVCPRAIRANPRACALRVDAAKVVTSVSMRSCRSGWSESSAPGCTDGTGSTGATRVSMTGLSCSPVRLLDEYILLPR